MCPWPKEIVVRSKYLDRMVARYSRDPINEVGVGASFHWKANVHDLSDLGADVLAKDLKAIAIKTMNL